ncbi:MAG: BtpA/SgcQ family protein [Planctomycetes bacterium]|nr:BtpA/SgcQ family protein [Planctomycetota bacterium]
MAGTKSPHPALFPGLRPWIVGVVHLGPLPGAPRYDGSIRNIYKNAVADARAYADAGFDAVIIENFGDAPFFPGRVPAETVAALGIAAAEVRAAVAIPAGVNCLRNDGVSAIAIAAAAGLDFVRINILAGAAVTDQGIITSNAHDVLRARARLAPNVKILADVRVKHAAPIAERSIASESRDLVARALADAVVVSGERTGDAPHALRLGIVTNALAGAAPVLVGSGLSIANARKLLKHASGAIVGTSVKFDGVTHARVDPARAANLIRSVRG